MHYVRDSAIPQLIDFFVCDDIRPEQNEKVSLVGFYGRSITIRNIPAVLPKLCFMAQFSLFSGPERLMLRVLSPRGTVILETSQVEVPLPPQTNAVPPEFRYSQMVFQIAPMQILEQGPYRVEFMFSNSRTVTAQFYIACPNQA